MRSKLMLGTVVAALMGGSTIVVAMLISRTSQNASQNLGLQLPVLIKQLPPENGVIPVELRCQNAQLTAPDTLESVPCVVKNNTSKNIRALSTEFTVVVENNGKETPDTGFLTLETFLHPDLDKAHMHKAIPPGQERLLEPSPTSYEGGVIKRVELKMDYVEFDDNSTLGPDENGSKLIALSRDGAAKYKEWLVKKYIDGGKSVSAIASLLNANDLPSELGFKHVNQSIGAKQYRTHLRDIYNSNGAAELEKYLNR